jgi:hypothetical protein
MVTRSQTQIVAGVPFAAETTVAEPLRAVVASSLLCPSLLLPGAHCTVQCSCAVLKALYQAPVLLVDSRKVSHWRASWLLQKSRL